VRCKLCRGRRHARLLGGGGGGGGGEGLGRLAQQQVEHALVDQPEGRQRAAAAARLSRRAAAATSTRACGPEPCGAQGGGSTQVYYVS
jgi:hypothetical protein